MDGTNFEFFRNLVELQKICAKEPNVEIFKLKNSDDDSLYFMPFPLAANQVFSGMFIKDRKTAQEYYSFLKNFRPAPGVDIELELDKANIPVLSVLIEGRKLEVRDDLNGLHMYLTGFGIYNRDHSILQKFYETIEAFLDSGEIDITPMPDI